MTLDRSTYEAWLLDRIEGTLTPEQEGELDAFLVANPDLAAAIEGLPAVPAGAPAFTAKELLRKHFPPTGAPDAARLTDFLIARLEGTLSTDQEQQLDRYLYEHPEATRAARLVAASRVTNGLAAFTDKASIARHFPPPGQPDKHRLTDFLIAAQEGDLSIDQQQALAQYVAAHPEAMHEQRLVTASRIIPEKVVFPAKERLKKREGRVVPLWTRLAAAASVVLVLGLGWWLLRGHEADEHRIARREKEKAPQAPAPVERTAPAVNEHPLEQRPDAAVPVQEKGKAGAAPLRGNAPSEQRSTPARQERLNGALPLRGTQPADLPEPSLAQAPPAPVLPPTADHEEALAQAAPVPSPAATGGTPIATFVANAVRDEVLDVPQRSATLDGGDAVAAVDKGLHALTGGTGGMQVQHTGTRERVHVRLGKNLAITASRGR